MASESPYLIVEGLRVQFSTPSGPVEVVSDVSFEVGKGETVAVVGESGSGKSVTALTIMGLVKSALSVKGSVRLGEREIANLPPAAMRRVRQHDISMVFQDPMSSLDPVYTIGNQVMEAVRASGTRGRKQIRNLAVELLREVGIPDPETRMKDYPHQLSGGQRQRVMVAIALAGSPKLMIADEPTTALDVTIEAQILQLMRNLQSTHDTALLLVTHDMGVVAEMADRVVVMYAGRVMEHGTVREVLTEPSNPYTQALLAAMLHKDAPRDQRLEAIEGSVPSPQDMPEGCNFSTRCPKVFDRCHSQEPPLFQIDTGRRTRCWLAEPHGTPVQEQRPVLLSKREEDTN